MVQTAPHNWIPKRLDFFERRLPIYVIDPVEAKALSDTTEMLGLAFKRACPADQFSIGKLVSSHLRLVAPQLSNAIGGALASAPFKRFQGIPIGGEGDELRSTVLSLLRGGEVFQYSEQSAQLTQPIEPKCDGAQNSSSSPDPFGFHTDDSVMPSSFRVEEIALLSVHNPVGILTGFALLEDIL